MAIEKQESQIALTKKRSSQTDDELRYLVPQTFNSLGSPPSSNDAITIIDDDDQEETLEPKKKKPRLGSWWDDVEAFNELSCVVKGLPKAKENDAASSVDTCFSSSTDLHETYTKKKKKDDEKSPLPSHHHDNFIDLCEDDETYSDSSNKENQDRVGHGHVSLKELGVTVKDLKGMPWEAFDATNWEIRSETMDPWLGGYVRDIMDSGFSTSTSDLHETKAKKQEDDETSLLSSSHHDNLIDLSDDESVGDESTSSTNKGNGHVSLKDLGVSVEDLKSMPWEAFDPTWEIRSETMDPWLGGYVGDMLSPC